MTNYFSSPIETSVRNSGGFLENLLGGILGKDENGNLKTVDLGKIFKLPDVNVKADETQSKTVLIVLIVAVLAFILNRK